MWVDNEREMIGLRKGVRRVYKQISKAIMNCSFWHSPTTDRKLYCKAVKLTGRPREEAQRDLRALRNMCTRPFEVPQMTFTQKSLKKRRKFPINFDKREPGPTIHHQKKVHSKWRKNFECTYVAPKRKLELCIDWKSSGKRDVQPIVAY